MVQKNKGKKWCIILFPYSPILLASAFTPSLVVVAAFRCAHAPQTIDHKTDNAPALLPALSAWADPRENEATSELSEDFRI